MLEDQSLEALEGRARYRRVIAWAAAWELDL